MKPLKLSLSLILIAVIFLSSGAGGSGETLKNPIPTPTKAGNEEKQKTTSKTQDAPNSHEQTKQQSFTLNLYNAPSNSKGKTGGGDDGKSESSTNWWIAAFTFALVLVAILQAVIYGIQAHFMKQGLEQTRTTAIAANANAGTAARQTEIMANRARAWIMVKPDSKPKEDPPKIPWGYEIEWSAINVGGTPAFLTELLVEVDILPMPLPNERPDYSGSRPFAKFIIPQNGRHSSKASKVFSPTLQGEYFRGESCVVLYGLVKYTDAIGDHITRFCCYWYTKQDSVIYEPVGPPDWVDYT